MKKKKNVKENVSTKSKKSTSILDSNWIVRITAIVILVPIVIVAVLLLTSIENSGEPVVGDRFDTHLTNEINDAKVKEVKDALVSDNVDAVQVNLKSATVRVLIDAADTADAATIQALANDAYNKVVAILPVETYFTNLVEDERVVKMYDLEIHAYNVIPNEETTAKQIYGVKYKNASNDAAGFDWITTPKDAELSTSLIRE